MLQNTEEANLEDKEGWQPSKKTKIKQPEKYCSNAGIKIVCVC